MLNVKVITMSKMTSHSAITVMREESKTGIRK